MRRYYYNSTTQTLVSIQGQFSRYFASLIIALTLNKTAVDRLEVSGVLKRKLVTNYIL